MVPNWVRWVWTTLALAALPTLAARLDRLREAWSGWREQYAIIPRFSELMAWAAQRLVPTLNRMLDVPGQFLAGAVATFAALFMTFFFVKDGPELRTQVLGLVPPADQADVGRVWDRLVERVGGYVVGQLTVMGLVGGLTALGLWLLGVPYALLLGLLGMVMAVPTAVAIQVVINEWYRPRIEAGPASEPRARRGQLDEGDDQAHQVAEGDQRV